MALFFLASFYTRYAGIHFIFTSSTTVLVLLPKHPALHKVRIFGINKY